MLATSTDPINHAAAEWVQNVVALLRSPHDVKTVPAWARHIGKSATCLRLRCQAAGISAKTSLDFARLLRGCLLSDAHGREMLEFVDIRDPRTLRRLVSQLGPDAPPGRLSPSKLLACARRVVPGPCLDLLSTLMGTVPARAQCPDDRTAIQPLSRTTRP